MPFISDTYKIKVQKSKPHPSGLREWQRQAAKQLSGSRYTFCTAPCGSGKSTMQVVLGAREVVDSHFTQKQLVVVPQSHISESFRKHSVKVGRTWYEWRINQENVYCDADQTVSRLRKWLLTKPEVLLKSHQEQKVISKLTAVCSYASLVQAFEGMTKAQKRRAYKNLSLRIDEAHHLNGLYHPEGEEGSTDALNQLSTVCHEAMNGPSSPSTRLHLTTATPMRGDRQIILSDKLKEQFVRYDLPWDKWFPHLGIKQIHISYEDYKSIGQLRTKVVEQAKKDIAAGRRIWVMIPPTGSEWRRRYATYAPLVSALRKLPGAKVMDLVHDEGRSVEPLYDTSSDVNVIVTCRFGLEGTDWVPCDTVYNLCVDGSVTMALQKWGRPLRKNPGKYSATLLNYVCFPDRAEEAPSKILASRVNLLLAYMTLGDALSTRRSLISPETLSIVRDCVTKSLWKSDNWVETAKARLVSSSVTTESIASFITQLQRLSEQMLSATFTVETFAKMRARFVSADTRDYSEWLVIAARLAQNNGGVLPSKSRLIAMGFGALVQCMRKHKDVFSHIPQENLKGRSPEDWVKIAETLAKDNGGTLPNTGYLQKNGYTGLELARLRRPELFSHIPQKRLVKSPEEWLEVAERLSHEHGGQIPGWQWRSDNGYSGLSSAMASYPTLFSRFTVKPRGTKTPDEWAHIAKSLAEANDGILPNHAALARMGYGGLSQAMRLHPELFGHIQQESKSGRFPVEWLRIAKSLVEKRGEIPNARWLCKNGFSGLYACIRKNPEIFTGLPRQREFRKTIEEHVSDAERLATTNGGVLPCHAWLEQNDFRRLSPAIRKHKSYFSHLKQERRVNQCL